jgi:hypothetical protein
MHQTHVCGKIGENSANVACQTGTRQISGLRFSVQLCEDYEYSRRASTWVDSVWLLVPDSQL